MKKISENELKTVLPNNSKATINEQYLMEYSLYRNWFTEYMMKKLNLEEYDSKLKNSGLNFEEVKEENMDIYQYFSSEKLRYFYLRNNIYPEKLNEEDTKFLQERIENGQLDLDEQAEEIIQKTYKTVIKETIGQDDGKYFVAYGPQNRNFFASNEALVIGMRYDEYVETNLNDEEWAKQRDSQLVYLVNLIREMTDKIEKEFDNPVKIIKYSQFSTRSRENLIEKEGEER